MMIRRYMLATRLGGFAPLPIKNWPLFSSEQKIDVPCMERYRHIFGGTWAVNEMHIPSRFVSRQSKQEWGYVDRVMHF